MFVQNVLFAAFLVLAACLLVASNPYGPAYNDDQEYKQEPSYHKPAPSYHRLEPSYQPQSYSPPAYHAPAYPKYQAPSSAHHTQYDNYYPKQTYSKPMYQASKPYGA